MRHGVVVAKWILQIPFFRGAGSGWQRRCPMTPAKYLNAKNSPVEATDLEISYFQPSSQPRRMAGCRGPDSRTNTVRFGVSLELLLMETKDSRNPSFG
ncbi:hypothetical protein K0M31_004568 [Melipona bicolor]|uniref:Uncharacterized protein n=1 Tax=Melipona bicolor TaxID=60889 RepID=A0AA40FX19_9HYME|nr:hypothetical protein K0M31_004568 [Melipona bicolor]